MKFQHTVFGGYMCLNTPAPDKLPFKKKKILLIASVWSWSNVSQEDNDVIQNQPVFPSTTNEVKYVIWNGVLQLFYRIMLLA